MIYAIGAFDGFHTGHCELLKTARRMAEAENCRWGVLTFDRNPQQFLSGGNFKQLFTDAERDFYAKLLNIPELVKIPFTKELAGLAPGEFMRLMKEKYEACGIVVGEDFRFGAGRRGDASFIRDYCAENNMAFSSVKTLEFNGGTVSSTRIRKLVCEGKIKTANELLGLPYYLSGEVVTGEQHGRLIGFPTANLLPENGKVYPKNGSYFTITLVENELYPSVTNIGFNPTFDGKKLICETHLPNFAKDIYGKKITVFFAEENRGEMKFESSEKLAEQLRTDTQKSAAVLKRFMKDNAALLDNIKAQALTWL